MSVRLPVLCALGLTRLRSACNSLASSAPWQLQLSAAVHDPRGMQLAAPGSTEAHSEPCAALVPFPVITHLLGSPFFREAAAGEHLVTALAGALEALADAPPDHLGAADFKVQVSCSAADLGCA